MPRTEIEIMGETTKVITERITVVVDIPQEILDGDHLDKWVEQQSQDGDSELSKEMNNPANIVQDDEQEGYDISSVTYIRYHD